jgi:hypothetical protein
MAQVYSVNAVGYVNVTLKKGYNLVSNPLNNGGNTLAEILPASSPLPEDTFVVTWNATAGSQGMPGAQQAFFGPGVGWDIPTMALPPGQGFFIYIDPNTAPQATYTITFVGEVPTGTLTTPVYGGSRYNSLASQVPQEGRVSADLGLVGQDDDMLLLWNNNATPPTWGQTAYFFGEGQWTDMVTFVEPVIKPGEAFFLFRAAPGNFNWTRTFNLN